MWRQRRISHQKQKSIKLQNSHRWEVQALEDLKWVQLSLHSLLVDLLEDLKWDQPRLPSHPVDLSVDLKWEAIQQTVPKTNNSQTTSLVEHSILVSQWVVDPSLQTDYLLSRKFLKTSTR